MSMMYEHTIFRNVDVDQQVGGAKGVREGEAI